MVLEHVRIKETSIHWNLFQNMKNYQHSKKL